MSYFDTALYVDSVQYTAVATWTTGSKSVGAIIRQLTTPAVGSERCFVCVVAGSAGGSEPVSWTTTRGGKTTDNAVTWQECSGVAALNGDATSTPTWNAAKSNAVTIGAVIKNVAGTFYFICTTAGTAGSGSEPSWTLTAGVTTADNTVTWTCLGAIGGFTTKWAAPHARLGTATGNTWTGAAAAGATVWVGDDHAETASTVVAINTQIQCYILCVDHTASLPPGSASLRTTATVTDTSGNNWSVFSSSSTYVYAYGVQFIKSGSNQLNVAATASSIFYFSNCVFKSTVAGSSPMNIGACAGATFDTCTFTFANASNTFVLQAAGVQTFKNCSFTGTAPTAGIQDSGSRSLFEGCDLSLLSRLLTASGGVNFVTFKDCKLNSAAAFSGLALVGVMIDLARCDNGGTNYRNERHTEFADETTSIAVVRTGGASDGVTPVSHQIITTSAIAAAQLSPGLGFHPAIPLAIWNAVIGTNRNVTVYGIVSDTRVPNNAEFWLDVEYLGSASSPQGSFATNRAASILASGTPISSDTSGWDSAATARQNSHAYSVGAIISVSSAAGQLFFCTASSGSSASSLPGGYASCADGSSVTDGSCTFRAGCRFQVTVTLSGVQPAQVGYLYVYPKFGRASFTYFIDPEPYLS